MLIWDLRQYGFELNLYLFNMCWSTKSWQLLLPFTHRSGSTLISVFQISTRTHSSTLCPWDNQSVLWKQWKTTQRGSPFCFVSSFNLLSLQQDKHHLMPQDRWARGSTAKLGAGEDAPLSRQLLSCQVISAVLQILSLNTHSLLALSELAEHNLREVSCSGKQHSNSWTISGHHV